LVVDLCQSAIACLRNFFLKFSPVLYVLGDIKWKVWQIDIIDICHTSPYHLRKLFFFLPAHQERFESLEIFCQLDALFGSFHEDFQFRRDLDICLQYLIDRSFEFGGMGGLKE